MNGHFVSNGKSFKIAPKAGTDEREIEVILPTGLAAAHVVEKKDLPAGIPTTWKDPGGQTHSVTWFNNFGLKLKGAKEFVRGPVAEDYEILVDQEAGKTLVYYDGEVKPFAPSDLSQPSDQPGKIAARLRLGDPPIGSG